MKRTAHQYSNGCTDHREVDLLALVVDHATIPIILGWRRASPRARDEPHFLTSEDELPGANRHTACMKITGAVVAYAHEGYSGAPAYAVEATRVEPAPCP